MMKIKKTIMFKTSYILINMFILIYYLKKIKLYI